MWNAYDLTNSTGIVYIFYRATSVVGGVGGCISSAPKAHGYTYNIISLMGNYMSYRTITNTKINNTFDDDAYPIGVVPRVRRDRLVQSDKTVLDEATKKSKVPLSLKAKKNVDPMPVLVSRDWSCAHVTSPCGHCRQFGRNRRMEYNNWKDRHPELNTP